MNFLCFDIKGINVTWFLKENYASTSNYASKKLYSVIFNLKPFKLK